MTLRSTFHPLRFIGIAMLLLMHAGCGHLNHVDSGCFALTQAKKYFASLKPGTPVSQIEKELGLGEPEKQRAPAESDPVWRLRYLRDNVVINFAAEAIGEDGSGRSDLAYYGEWSIKTKEEVDREIRQLLEKGGMPKSSKR